MEAAELTDPALHAPSSNEDELVGQRMNFAVPDERQDHADEDQRDA